MHLRKRVDLKDRNALRNMAMEYGHGRLGMPLDQQKCVDLLRDAADLGCPSAHYQLGNFHHSGEMGLEQNEEEALKYLKKAAEGGHILALHNLACTANENGDHAAAMRYWRLAASEGSKLSMNSVIMCFEEGFLHHGDLAEALQAMYIARAEMKSEDRDEYIEYLKRAGRYKGEYDL